MVATRAPSPGDIEFFIRLLYVPIGREVVLLFQALTICRVAGPPVKVVLSDLDGRRSQEMFETLKKLFTPAQTIEAPEAREFLDKHETGTYTLLDVRQPSEYEREHIPGATLIPLPQLGDAFDQLDPEKPVIVY
jgi:hypothetical protein